MFRSFGLERKHLRITGPIERLLFTLIKGAGKVVPVHAIKAYRGSRDIAPLILNLGIKWR
jgi:hypothetical protein